MNDGDRERLTHTLGILLAGLLEAEQDEAPESVSAADSEREPRLRHGSGVYALGDTVSDPPPRAPARE